MIIFNTPHCQVTYQHGNRILRAHWKGVVSLAHYKEVAKIILSFAHNNEVDSVLSDRTEVSYICESTQQWAKDHLWHPLAQTGVQHYAIVSPNVNFHRFLIESLEADMKHKPVNLRLSAFVSVAEAEKALCQPKRLTVA